MHSYARILTAAGLALAAALTASAKIERTIERVFVGQPGGTLSVDTDGGSIEVKISDSNEVKVIAKEHIRAESEGEADALLRDLTLTMDQKGAGVAIVAKYAKPSSGFHLASWPPVETSFVITVPAMFSADLRTSGGAIEVGDLGGHVHLKTSGGDLKLGKIGSDVDAMTSGGNIDVDAAGGRAHLVTSGGNISADHLIGAAELLTSGGDIKVGTMANTLTARTSGGSVRVEFVGALQGDCSLATDGGSIKLKLERGVGCKVDASTSGGSVKTEDLVVLADSGRQRSSRLVGTISGGGPTLRLRSSGGDVVLSAR